MASQGSTEVDAAIDAYLAAEEAVLSFFQSDRPTAEYFAISERFRKSYRRLASLLTGWTEAYTRAGYRWQVDPAGELHKVPDDGMIQSHEAKRAKSRRSNNRRIV